MNETVDQINLAHLIIYLNNLNFRKHPISGRYWYDFKETDQIIATYDSKSLRYQLHLKHFIRQNYGLAKFDQVTSIQINV